MYVAFSHHRPHFARQDMRFFEIARREFSLIVDHVSDTHMTPMFENDPGPEEVHVVFMDD